MTTHERARKGLAEAEVVANALFADEVRAAVLAEREAIAKLAEELKAFYEVSLAHPGLPGRYAGFEPFAAVVRGRPAP